MTDMITLPRAELQMVLEAMQNLLNEYYSETICRNDLKKAEQAITALCKRLSHCYRCGKTVGDADHIYTCTPKHSGMFFGTEGPTFTANGVPMEQPQQEPELYQVTAQSNQCRWLTVDAAQYAEYTAHGWIGRKLYTAPQQQEQFDTSTQSVGAAQTGIKQMQEPVAKACANCWGTGVDVAGKPCPCGCKPSTAAQPVAQQEPVLWMMPDGKIKDKWALQFYGGQIGKPLYTAPQRREWRGLTDEEINTIGRSWYGVVYGANVDGIFARAIEAKLKERNS